MISQTWKQVKIASMAVHLPEQEVTSLEVEDWLAPTYERLGIPFGTLEKLSGVKTRRLWPKGTMPSSVASEAARKAVHKLDFPKEEIRAVINTSVTRDFFEPATACLVHRGLGLPESALVLDISNACIGFSNGLAYLASLIETGTLKAGIVVSGETITPIVESSVAQLVKREDISRDDLIKILPAFTLGCGAVAYVLCHSSLAPEGPSLIGNVSCSATEFTDLCIGNADYQLSDQAFVAPLMYTESTKLISSAAKLGGRMFKSFSRNFEWQRQDIDHIFCHQVGKQVNEAFYAEMGLDIDKEFTIYRKLGNLVSAALPAALAIGSQEKSIKKNEKVLLTAFGSGLNSIFSGIVW